MILIAFAPFLRASFVAFSIATSHPQSVENPMSPIFTVPISSALAGFKTDYNYLLPVIQRWVMFVDGRGYAGGACTEDQDASGKDHGKWSHRFLLSFVIAMLTKLWIGRLRFESLLDAMTFPYLKCINLKIQVSPFQILISPFCFPACTPGHQSQPCAGVLLFFYLHFGWSVPG